MPSDLITSTMKSDPERFSVRTSSTAGVSASSSFGMGCAVPARETSACCAFATAGIAASAAAPAAAPFQKFAPIDRFFFGFSHRSFRWSRKEILFMPIDFPSEWPALCQRHTSVKRAPIPMENAWTHQIVRLKVRRVGFLPPFHRAHASLAHNA